MKEFGIKDDCYYYVVYLRDEDDLPYEREKDEIIDAWDKLNVTNAKKLIDKCRENEEPFDGIPYDKENEIIAIVISADEHLSASFLRIAPKLQNDMF